jgi:3-oxoadipate enol-lactonase
VVRVRGVDLAVTDTGAGRPVLWGHGLTSSTALEEQAGFVRWDRIDPPVRLLRWDARSHGRSDGTADPSAHRWDELGRDVLALADALGVERPVLGGASMGAASVLHAAAQAPERAAGLVLALPPTAWATRPAQAAAYAAGADLVDARGAAAYVEQARAEPQPEILAAFAGAFTYTPDVADHLLAAVLRGAAASDLPAPDVLRALAVPTLVLAWDTDPGHPVSTAEALGELLPRAEVHVARTLRDVATWTSVVETFLRALDTERWQKVRSPWGRGTSRRRRRRRRSSGP